MDLVIGIIIVMLLFIIVSYIVLNKLYDVAINSRTDKSFVLDANKNQSSDSISRNHDEEIQWFKKYPKTEVYIESFDYLKLHAYRMECDSKSPNWVIVSHGYFGNVEQLSHVIKNFIENNFNVLAIEARGHGKSSGDYIGLGWYDRIDILDWIKYLNNHMDNSNIVLYGISMGAASTMMASGEELPKNVRCIIADCGYTSAYEEFSYQVKKLYKLPPFPILNIFDVFVKLKTGYSLKDVNVIKQLKKNQTPILFIQGDQDTFVPSYMIEKLYDSTLVYKKKLIVKDAEHAESYYKNPVLYWDTVYNFIDEQINDTLKSGELHSKKLINWL